MNKQQSGITLIELMIVMVIVGILAAVAIPSYRSYMLRSNRTEAKAELTSTAGALERCYTRFNVYNHAECGTADALEAGGTIGTPHGYYVITGVVEAQEYELEAEPQGGQAEDAKCMTLQLNSRNVKGKTGTDTVDNCWGR